MRRIFESRSAWRVDVCALVLAAICAGCSGNPDSPPSPTNAGQADPKDGADVAAPPAGTEGASDDDGHDAPLIIARLLTVNELTRLHWKGWETEPEMRVLVTSVDRQLSDRQRLGVDWQTVIVRNIERVPPNCRDDERQTLAALDADQDELLRPLDDGSYSYARVYRKRIENQHCITCHDKMLADDDAPAVEGDEPASPRVSAILLRIRFPETNSDEER
jgi:hypothetical protein